MENPERETQGCLSVDDGRCKFQIQRGGRDSVHCAEVLCGKNER